MCPRSHGVCILDSHVTVTMRLFSNFIRVSQPGWMCRPSAVLDFEVIKDRASEIDPGIPLLQVEEFYLQPGPEYSERDLAIGPGRTEIGALVERKSRSTIRCTCHDRRPTGWSRTPRTHSRSMDTVLER